MNEAVLLWGGSAFSNHKLCHSTYSGRWDLLHLFFCCISLYCRDELYIFRAESQMWLLGIRWSTQPKMEHEWVAMNDTWSWTTAFFTSKDQNIYVWHTGKVMPRSLRVNSLKSELYILHFPSLSFPSLPFPSLPLVTMVATGPSQGCYQKAPCLFFFSPGTSLPYYFNKSAS